MTAHQISIQFFLQLAFILAAIRLVGGAARLAGQPQVVGEMIAGVLIGPSFLGHFYPGLQAALFPKETIPVIYAVSQIGLVMYMFLIGAEFSTGLLRNRLRSAVFVSVAGIATPFLLGAAITPALLRRADLFSPEATLWQGILFTGSAMSITAFPMLARIIHERGIAGTSLGTLALAAGSMDDAAAWCFLAVVVASFGGGSALVTIGGGVLYALVILGLARPLLTMLEQRAKSHNGVSGPMLGFVMLLLCLGAWATDAIGIYAVFGAFLMGIAMPRGIVTRDLHRVIEPVATNFFLPLFFVYSGLNTRLDMLIGPEMLGVAVLVIAASIAGKGVACWGAARLSGEDGRDALAVGALMNARGLMELILINVGLQHGIIQGGLFTVMVLMAVVTTLMATPLFELVYRRMPAARASAAPDPVTSHVALSE